MNRRFRIAARGLAWLARLGLLSVACTAMLAQPQIGGGPCTSATLSGNYSLTLTGRDVGSTATLSTVSLGAGTATFDGLSKVTLTLTANTAKSQGMTETLSGTYSLQVNCIGVITITSGDTASFTLESYNQGKSYLITGQDGTYAFNGSGSLLPASCSASEVSGTYSFNGNGFQLTSATISGVADFSGLMQFDGTSAVTSTWYVSAGGSTQTVTASGTYTVNSNCSATASLTDNAGHAYALQLTVTSGAGNFIFGGTSPAMVFTGSGRTL